MFDVKKVASILVLLILSLTLVVAGGQTEAQADYTIEVSDYTWNHARITVSVFPQENESWWDPSYLCAALHGIAQWNDAVQGFASNYTEFSYISEILFVPSITHEMVEGLDVYMSWAASCEGNESTIGLTENIIVSPCTVVNSTICLATQGPDGHVMTEADMQNIVVHELGHVLALYHSNYPDDVMYPSVVYGEDVRPISSLDLYAVSQSFKWLSSTSPHSNRCPQKGTLTLPSNISYVYFQVAAENLPSVPAPQRFLDYLSELLLRPEVLAIFFAVVLLVVAVVVFSRRKKPRENLDSVS